MKLSAIVKKDLRLLFRSKGTLLLLVFGPLLVMFLVGIAFDNSNAYRINVGVYSKTYNNLTKTFVSKLDKPFNVVKFQSSQKCIDATKEGRVNTCLVFPDNLSLNSSNSTVTFYVDYSKINLVWIVRDVVFAKLSQGNSEITEDLTNTLLKKLNDVEDDVTSSKPLTTQLLTYVSFINQYSSTISHTATNIDTSKPNVDTSHLSADIKALYDSGNSAIDKAVVDLESVKSALNKEGNHTELVATIGQQINALKSLKGSLTLLYDSRSNSAVINRDLVNLSAQISDIGKRFDDISSSLQSINSNVEDIKTKIQLSYANIADIQGVFDKIKQEIDTISVRQASKIVHPITISIRPLSQHKTHLGLMFPTILVIILMFAGLMLGSTVITINKNSKAVFRNLISPVKPFVFTVSSFLTLLLLLVPQVILLSILSLIFLKSEISHELLSSFVALTIIVTLFAVMGMLIGYLTRREESSILSVLTLSTLMLLLSNVLIPLEAVPHVFSRFIYFNPFVLSQLVMNKILIFNFSLAKLSKPVLILVAYTLLLFALCLLSNKSNLNKPHKEVKAKE